jgi:hypothetical protein
MPLCLPPPPHRLPPRTPPHTIRRGCRALARRCPSALVAWPR